MNIVRRAVTAALVAVRPSGSLALPCATFRYTDQGRQHAGADRSARLDRPRAPARGRDLRRRSQRRGGLLGRPVEWIVKDDQSKPDLARTLYEQLITSDKVDLLMGPYATGAILSAMGVAQRYNKLLIHHTFGIPSLAKYEGQFPAWSLGPDPGNTFTNTLYDALRRAAQSAQDHRGRHQQVPVDTFHGARRARGREKARPQRGPVPGMGVRQQGLRSDRRPHQGRQSRLHLRRRHRARRQPAPRRAEEDRLHAEVSLLHVSGAGPDGARSRTRRTRSPPRCSRSIRRSSTTRAPPRS